MFVKFEIIQSGILSRIGIFSNVKKNFTDFFFIFFYDISFFSFIISTLLFI